MLNKKLLIVLYLFVFTLALNSQNKGYPKYLSVKAGLNAVDNSGDHQPFASFSDTDKMATSRPFAIGADYRFSRLFSAGVFYSINRWKSNDGKIIDNNLVTDPGAGIGTQTGDVDYHSADVNVKFYFDELSFIFKLLFGNKERANRKNRDILDLYALGGASVFSEQSGDLAGVLGGGINLWVTDRFGVNVEGVGKFSEQDFTGSNHLQYFAGITYRFGKRYKDCQQDTVVVRKVDTLSITEKGQSILPTDNYVNNDTDNDGVTNSYDRCPDIAGTIENLGCPGVPDKITTIEKFTPKFSKQIFHTSRSVKFKIDSDSILPKYTPVLDLIIKNLKPYPNLPIKIVGHTDTTASPEHNKKLSVRRANNVMNYLKQNGLPNNKYIIEGVGENDPLSSNLNQEGKYQNRRIEILVGEKINTKN